MKYLVVSDIHGSLFYASKIIEIMKKENIDKLILLGDLYYHGPRNPLPKEYNPMEVSKLLNSLKDQLICIKGNCDAEVDEMISEFQFNESVRININNKIFMFTHGHKYNIDKQPDDFDILIYGHFHTGFIRKQNDKLFINAGSMSLPKNETKNSYLIIDDNYIYLKDLENNNIIEDYKYN